MTFVASIINIKYKPTVLYWVPTALSADRAKITNNLPNTKVIFEEPSSDALLQM